MLPSIPVAIIGMGCFFPKASGPKEYWRLLFQGEDAITEVPPTHWSAKDYFDEDLKKPDHVYCKRGGFLSPIAFDPTEFGIPPATLEATDTSQLLGLVAAKMALEDAGYGPSRPFDRDRTSVILGVTGTQELVIPLSSRLGHPQWRQALEDSHIPADRTEEIVQRISGSYVSWQENSFPGLLGNVVAGRICNRLDLGGTNCVVDAACASALSAVHLALLELISGRSDMVLTGGVDTFNDIFMHMCFAKTYLLSPTGDIRPFAKDADGTLLGEGIGVLVLKRLAEAERDGDKVYAVIRGLGSSSDGKSQSIYAPRQEGQARALQMAYENAGITPSTVRLVEGHGTGTRVGDRVEFQALRQVFGPSNGNGPQCALGSVKSMIGHTKAAAGAAGLMKAALALYHKVLPPTLKAAAPDPRLNIDQSPFYLNPSSRPWFSDVDHPRRAGVSSFGFGGSNFHVVLEEFRSDKRDIAWDGSVEIAAFSAQELNELGAQIKAFKNAVDGGLTAPELSSQIAESRQRFVPDEPFRLLLMSERGQDLSALLGRSLAALNSTRPPIDLTGPNIFFGGPERSRKMAFLFPGQGSQYTGMGRDLICIFPEALRILEKANQKYKKAPKLGDVIFPRPLHSPGAKDAREIILRQTQHAQPAIGAVSLAMLKILQKFGLRPDATGGHSFGELTALCAAGWVDEDSFLDLAIARGDLMAAAGHHRGQE
ncbi:MAG: acyltransferase domain-containing protein, partial [Desulfobacterales bacterium]